MDFSKDVMDSQGHGMTCLAVAPRKLSSLSIVHHFYMQVGMNGWMPLPYPRSGWPIWETPVTLVAIAITPTEAFSVLTFLPSSLSLLPPSLFLSPSFPVR